MTSSDVRTKNGQKNITDQMRVTFLETFENATNVRRKRQNSVKRKKRKNDVSHNANSKRRQTKYCGHRKNNGAPMRVYNNHKNDLPKSKTSTRAKLNKLQSMLAKMLKKQKSTSRKRKKHARAKETNDSSDSSVMSSELHDSSLGCDTRHKRLNKRSKIHNKLHNENQSTNVVQPNINLNNSTEHVNRNFTGLTNNLFVYNEQSYPTRLRKQIREQLEFSPEVVVVFLLSEIIDGSKKKDNKDIKIPTS